MMKNGGFYVNKFVNCSHVYSFKTSIERFKAFNFPYSKDTDLYRLQNQILRDIS